MKLSANKKKVIVLASMVVLLVVAGTLNFVLNNNLPKLDAGIDEPDVTTTFFSALRTTRESKRAEQIAYYDSIINSESSTAEAIKSAQDAKLELAKMVETELKLENVIKSCGYNDVVVTLASSSVHVTLNKAELDKSDFEAVYTAVYNNSDYSTSQVTIIPYLEEK